MTARVALLTGVAMIAFAANSVLARLAFATVESEPMSYTGLRLASGALVLYLIHSARNRSFPRRVAGSWGAAAALFGYALAFSIAYVMLGAAFSIAYVMLGAGTGALILFASVQIGILGWAMAKGDRPGALEWIGLIIAAGAFAYLVSPGLVAPEPVGSLLMVAAGLCWAAYTLLGRGSHSPLVDTAGNFIRTTPIAALLLVFGLIVQPLDPVAATYAVASGALASGLGYAVWYAALPHLQRTTAAIVQLTVPAIAALGGVLLISEPLTLRLMVASIGILGGVAVALVGADRRRPRSA
jgi:drug/metabolite transporter (DMT)-like permease